MDSPTSSAIPNPQNQPPSSPTQKSLSPIQKFKNLPKKKKILMIAAGLIFILGLIGILIFVLNQSDRGPRPQNTVGGNANNFTPVNKPATAIAKVGDEYIYQEDLEVELANYAGNKDENVRKILIDKLVKDSIILQAAKKENLATVSGEIFNSNLKNYGKRFGELKAVEERFNNNIPRISGTVVTVWFYNMYPAKIGLEAGKAEALKRITALHTRVKNGEITIEQAGDLIANDPSYVNLDFGYNVNALYSFTEPEGDRITFDDGYNEILWKTNPGEITEVYLAKTINEFTNLNDEAFYIFGKVTEKTDGNGQGFAEWYEKQKGNYEVTYY